MTGWMLFLSSAKNVVSVKETHTLVVSRAVHSVGALYLSSAITEFYALF